MSIRVLFLLFLSSTLVLVGCTVDDDDDSTEPRTNTGDDDDAADDDDGGQGGDDDDAVDGNTYGPIVGRWIGVGTQKGEDEFTIRVQVDAGRIGVGEEAGVAMYLLDEGRTECPRSWMRSSENPPEYSFDCRPQEPQECPAGRMTITHDASRDVLEFSWMSDESSARGELSRAPE